MMQNPSTVSQESAPLFDLVAQVGRFAFSSRFFNSSSDECSSFKSNYLYFDSFKSSIGQRKRNCKVSAASSFSLRSGKASSVGSFNVSRFVNEFNKAIRFHCERLPIGFASVGINSSERNGIRDENGGVLEDEGLPLNGIENDQPKKVLILMSDTGGGHRASAEAIKAAFHEKFGNEYEVSINFNFILRNKSITLFALFGCREKM